MTIRGRSSCSLAARKSNRILSETSTIHGSTSGSVTRRALSVSQLFLACPQTRPPSSGLSSSIRMFQLSFTLPVITLFTNSAMRFRYCVPIYSFSSVCVRSLQSLTPTPLNALSGHHLLLRHKPFLGPLVLVQFVDTEHYFLTYKFNFCVLGVLGFLRIFLLIFIVNLLFFLVISFG